MNITRATPEAAATLTAIAFAAKAHWGYPRDWLSRWAAQLTITPAYIAANPTYALSGEGQMLGFHAVQITGTEAVLDHLWVAPAMIGHGIGRALFAHAERIARDGGAVRLRITGDPHAEGFYLRVGAVKTGEQPAPMNGTPRFLPLFVKPLG